MIKIVKQKQELNKDFTEPTFIFIATYPSFFVLSNSFSQIHMNYFQDFELFRRFFNNKSIWK